LLEYDTLFVSCTCISLCQDDAAWLQALLSVGPENSIHPFNPAQTMQLLLLAQICAACEDSDSSSPKAAETSSSRSNAEAVEALLAVLRTADQLPGLLLGLVKSCVQQLPQVSSRGSQGLLPEALPGEAPGCGELLKSKKLSQKALW